MRKTLTTVLLILLSILFQKATAQAFDWAQIRQGIGADLCLDPLGNSFTAGPFIGTVTLGSYSFTSAGAQDVIIAKYTPNGNLVWALKFGGPQSDYAQELVYDNNGHIWVTGQFSGTMQAGSFNLISSGGTDAYLVKINAANGLVVFADRFGSTGNDVGMAIKADVTGNIYIAGTYMSNFSFGTVTLSNLGSFDAFIVQVNNAGVPQWGQRIAGSGIESIWTMNIDAMGNIYLGGFGNSVASQMGSTTVNLSPQKHFVVKFDNTGNYQWVALSDFNGEIYGISIDAAGSVYFTGNFDTQAVFGPFTLTNSGPNDDALLVKIDNAGNYCWAQFFGSTGSDQGYDLKCNSGGDLFLTGSFEGSVNIGSFLLNAGGSGQSYVAKFDSSGTALWVLQSSSSALNYSRAIARNQADEIYICGIGSNNITFGNHILSFAGGGGYLVKIADNANIIQGTVFRDMNNDGSKDPGESGIPNTLLQLNTGPYVSNSGTQGIYQIYTAAGTYSVSIPSLPLYHTLSTPVSQTSTFTGLGAMDTAKHFGLYPTPNINDLRIILTPVTRPKAGFVQNYQITYINIGTTTLNTDISLTADPSLNFIQSSPAPSSQSGQVSTWNIGNLAPQSMGNINALYGIPTTLMIGDSLITTANITPLSNDFVPSDNSSTNISLVVGPYDPNYKEVNIDSIEISQLIADNPWFEYIIHFQNIGNDSAHTVLITDSLSQSFDIPTLEILANSHPMQFSIKGTGMAEFRFDNIMLPDSMTNPITSCGFVKYRIKTLTSGISINDSLPNYASIYFDYNPPIITNTATTKIYNLVSTDADWGTIGLGVYPVPSYGDVNIIWKKQLSQPGIITLYNLTGMQVYSDQISETSGNILHKLKLGHLQAGLYILEVREGDRKLNARIIIQP